MDYVFQWLAGYQNGLSLGNKPIHYKMIYDHISNLERYRSLHSGIYEALKFLASTDASLQAGRHKLSGENYVNVMDYSTLEVNTVGYEVHRKYIDIQYCICGEERVALRQLNTLTFTTPYNVDRDVAFAVDDHKPHDEVTIGNGYFLILFGNDGHMPQLCIGEPKSVKKAIAKVTEVIS